MTGNTKHKSPTTNHSLNGWLIIDKPEGITSAKAVHIIKKATGADKVGHAGTLDPFASGILPIALGEATKAMQFCTDYNKIYRFTAVFGEARDTDDREGKVINSSGRVPSETEILALLPSFIGEIEQTPPQYSAIKIDGKRAYDLARKGEKVEIKSRPVTVHSLELLSYNPPAAEFRMACGKGTYVRSIARDLAEKLGTYAYVSALRREAVGKFSSENAISLEELQRIVHIAATSENGFGHDFGQENILGNKLLPVSNVLDDIPVYELEAESALKLRQGQRIKIDHSDQEFLKVLSDGKLVAIGQVRAQVLRSVRVFNL